MPCKRVKRWIEKEVQVPVEKAVTQATRSCTEYRRRIEKSVKKRVEKWVSKQERKCKKRKWYDPRRWVCTIINTVIKIFAWVTVLVIEWVPYLICKIVTNVIKIVVSFVVRLVKFLVTFVVCIFTDPWEALKSIRDLWRDIVDIFEDIIEFLKSFIDDAADIVSDIERLTTSVACGFGPAGTFADGIAKWVLSRVREFGETVYEALNNALSVIVGALNLNWCRAADGLIGLGADVVRSIVWGLSIPIGAGGGIRDAVRSRDLAKMIEGRLQVVTDNERLLEEARDRIGLGNCVFGLPFTLEPKRFYLTSRPSVSDDDNFTPIDLRDLHKSGAVDLYELAGLISGCGGPSALWDSDKIATRGRFEAVFAGTSIPVTYRDLDLFLTEGPDAVEEFRIYPIPLHVFDRYLKIAKRKAYSIGVDLFWDRIEETEWMSVSQSDPIGIPDSGTGQALLFPRHSRIGLGSDICIIPMLAGFRYVNNNNRRGFASSFPAPINNPSMTGVTFRDGIPEFLFQWVPIHEMGHYFNLQHAGHDGFGKIMFTPAPQAGLDTWTSEAVVEFLLTGEPQFTPDDAFTVWNWIVTNAQTCLFGEELEPVIE